MEHLPSRTALLYGRICIYVRFVLVARIFSFDIKSLFHNWLGTYKAKQTEQVRYQKYNDADDSDPTGVGARIRPPTPVLTSGNKIH